MYITKMGLLSGPLSADVLAEKIAERSHRVPRLRGAHGASVQGGARSGLCDFTVTALVRKANPVVELSASVHSSVSIHVPSLLEERVT